MNEQLLQKVLSCSKLPSLPAVAVRVIELTSDDNVTMRDLASVIENDQGLSTKVLQTVNSAFYGLPKQCSTLTHAQALLGLNAIKTLALGFSLVHSLQEDEESGFDYPSYWRRSVYTAVGAKAIASMVRCCDAEEAFLGGLLQDVGMIALSKGIGDEYNALARMCSADHRALTRREIAEFDLQHPDVGAMLAERWRLPNALVTPIKYHERPTAAPLAMRGVVRSVALGNIIAEVMMSEDRAYWLTQFYRRANQWFCLNSTQADEILDVVTGNSGQVARLFDVDMGKTPSTSEILELAGDRLSTIALEENRNSTRIAAENEEFHRAINVDALTGAGSRRRFFDQAADLFDMCELDDEPLSVILMDVDQFRAINDELGNETGDLALVRLTQRLNELLAPMNIEIYRYGGEAFGALLPGMDKRQATELAERVRAAVSASPLGLGAGMSPEASEVAVTISLGVATLDRETVTMLNRSERLIHAAEKAVRAAKSAGRDCVRAFSPKRRAAA